MFWKVTAVAIGLAALASSLSLERVLRLLLGSFEHTLRDFDVFERQIELFRIELLGLRPKLLPAQFADDAFQRCCARTASARAASVSASRAFRRAFSSARALSVMTGSCTGTALPPSAKQPRVTLTQLSRQHRRRTASGRTSRQSSPSNSAENCAGDIVITPSRIAGQTNFAPSRRL